MFQLLKQPKFDFMSRGKLFLVISLVMVVASIAVLSVRGLNKGVEFTGGTELQVKYAEAPDVGAIRSLLTAEGLQNHTVTTIGKPEDHEIYVRIASDADVKRDEEMTSRVAGLLRGEPSPEDTGKLDLNVADQSTLRAELEKAVGLLPSEADAVAAAITERRRNIAIFGSLDDLSDIEGLAPSTLDFLREKTYTGRLALRSQSYIFPSVGRELLNKAMLAVVGSLMGMLLYIWVRFQLQWGFAAVVALAHDTLITLGLFSLFQMEMTLPVVAAFLTLVGYSVNDTVVVFDRIRENMRSGSESFVSTVNRSINQTLSRTVITSGLTWIVVFGLFMFGGSALKAFAFVLTVGVVVGTYSSICVASPLLVLGRELSNRKKAPAVSTATGGRARKVRA